MNKIVLRKKVFFLLMMLFPALSHASFIESTMGAAVVNDATATYFNPAALTLLKNPQLIALGSIGNLHTQFTGNVTTGTGFMQSGSSSASTHYYLPSLYVGVPNHRVTFGFGVVCNFFNRNIEEFSILRYNQSGNSIKNIDFVPAIGIKINDFFSLGVGLNFSTADILLQPITGIPSLNVPDSQSQNDSNALGVGADIGALFKMAETTVMGINYRSAITYQLKGKSVYQGTPQVISNNYHFDYWTPARIVFSVNHFFTPTFGMIGTLQYIQWNIFNTINIYGIANQINSQPVILNATVPLYFHNAWLGTLGTFFRITPKWIIRLAGSYNQSPSGGDYQISNGDSIIVGISTAYKINSHITLDGSYAHSFIQDKNINITALRSIINGVNTGALDSVAIKLTLNM